MSQSPEYPAPKQEGIGKYLLLAGGGCAVFLGFIGAVVFFVFYIMHSTGAGRARPQAQKEKLASSPLPKSQQREVLRISDVNVEKQPGTGATTVNIRFKVRHFASNDSGTEPRIHLIQDLKTYDPGGNLVQDLSVDGIKELQDNGVFEYADFWNTLTIPTTYAQGKYKAQLIIHDQIGNTNTETTTEFELP